MGKEAKRFGENFKRIRTRKCLSQREIAGTLGVHKGLISNIEHGKTNPTLTTIAKLAKALGVPIGELIK